MQLNYINFKKREPETVVEVWGGSTNKFTKLSKCHHVNFANHPPMDRTCILGVWAEKNILLELLHERIAEDIFSGTDPKYLTCRPTRRDQFICRILATQPK